MGPRSAAYKKIGAIFENGSKLTFEWKERENVNDRFDLSNVRIERQFRSANVYKYKSTRHFIISVLHCVVFTSQLTQYSSKMESARSLSKMDYSQSIFLTLKALHPKLAISSKSIWVINSLLNAIAEILATTAAKLSKKKELSCREIQAAVRRMFPGNLARLAIHAGLNSVVSESRPYPIFRPTLPASVQEDTIVEQNQLPFTRQRSTRLAYIMETQKKQNLAKQHLHQMILADRDLGLKKGYCPVKGRSVITTRTFKQSEFVCEYAGEYIPCITDARGREKKYNEGSNIGSFMYFFNFQGEKRCIDATEETDRLGRLINHSIKNQNLIPDVVSINGRPRVIFLASKDIPVNTEILYDYGDRSAAAKKHSPWLFE